MFTVTHAVEDEVGPFEAEALLAVCSTIVGLLVLEEDVDEVFSADTVLGCPVDSVWIAT